MRITWHTTLSAILLSFVVLGTETHLPGKPSVATQKQQPIIATSYEKGISGHALGGSLEYNDVPVTEQIALVKKLNATYYRTEITTFPSGIAAKEKKLHKLMISAKAQEVRIIPVLFLTQFNLVGTTYEAYIKGKTLGRGFASRYSAYFDVYEVGNEEARKSLFPGADGADTTDYRTSVFKLQAAFFRGMTEGIREAHPEAKIMVNEGWLHYGFIKRLLNNNVKIDIIGWHWYLNHDILAKRRPYNIPDIGVKLHGMFPELPIWFTEIGRRGGSMGPDGTSTPLAERQQAEFITAFGNALKNRDYVKVVVAYEMFDQLERKDGNFEKYNGLFKWTVPYTQFVEKPAASAFKNL